VNPSGTYILVCAGRSGTLQLNIGADGQLMNSKVSLEGKTETVFGQFNEMDGLIEFKVESDDHSSLQFNGYAMTFENERGVAFAGTGFYSAPSMSGLAPGGNHFGWWATSQSVNN
jgi:hypothetical protein